jgi:para-aminobenzoate synthetase component 1
MSKVCEPGSVKVKELFGLYSFPQVHQMISTIEGTMPAQAKFSEALKATFPMGSMTGAPKKKVMQIIDETEPESRGLFSGAIGYISPEEDFDFNVVIRSIFYDEEAKVLTAWAGGGITHYSEAEKEYEESLLKIETIKKILES